MKWIFIHGWSSNNGIWAPLLQSLSADHCECVSLPGHGGADDDQRVAAMLEKKAGPMVLCGWSLGGLLALKYAQAHPEQVAGLILICPIASFLARPHWPAGMPAKTFDRFEQRFFRKEQGDHRYFSLLMAQGTEDPETWQRERLALESAFPAPTCHGLKAGLSLLKHLDVTDGLRKISSPTLLIAGKEDRLVSHAAVLEQARQLPRSRLVTLSGVGHLPHVVKPLGCRDAIQTWLDDERF